jgi:hypothetical protein
VLQIFHRERFGFTDASSHGYADRRAGPAKCAVLSPILSAVSSAGINACFLAGLYCAICQKKRRYHLAFSRSPLRDSALKSSVVHDLAALDGRQARELTKA